MSNKLRSHVENMADMVAKGRSMPGERNPAAKLTADAVESIRQAIAGGASRRSLARHHGVSQRTIQRIDQGLRWQPAAAARAIEGSVMANYSELARVLLDRVSYGKSELTIDAADMSPEAVSAVRTEAAVRGLHVSGTSRWLLVRALETGDV